MFYVTMCVVVCSRCQCVLLHFLGGKVSCCMFYMAMCVVLCFKWQSELLYVVDS